MSLLSKGRYLTLGQLIALACYRASVQTPKLGVFGEDTNAVGSQVGK